MSDVITTLHRKDDPSVNIYPNVKIDNIPSEIMRIADLGTYVNQLTSINITGDIDSVSMKSDVGTFTTADIGTLNVSGISDFEGNATFGSNITVDGKVVLNSADDVVDKDGNKLIASTDLTDFKALYNRERYQYLFAGAKNLSRYEETEYSDFSPEVSFTNISNATSIIGMFQGASFESGTNLLMPNNLRISGINSRFFLYEASKPDNDLVVTFQNYEGTGYQMFYLCPCLKEINVRDGYTCHITSARQFLNISVNITKISGIDFTGCTDFFRAFASCQSITEIDCTGFGASFAINETALEHDALVTLIASLDPVTTTQTLTMGSTKMALLSTEEIQVATGKGWVIA